MNHDTFEGARVFAGVQMFDEQAAIWKALMDLLNSHASELLHWHISDLVTLGGKSDLFGFAKSAPDLAYIRAGVRKIVRSLTWKSAVRGPAGFASTPSWGLLGLFNHHFSEGSSRHAYLAAANSHSSGAAISDHQTARWGLDGARHSNSAI